jgi:hypothetical protein
MAITIKDFTVHGEQRAGRRAYKSRMSWRLI